MLQHLHCAEKQNNKMTQMRKAGSPFELCRMQIGEFRHHRASKSKDRAKSIMARKLPVCTWT